MFTGFEKTSIRIKQNSIIFVRHFSFLSDKNFQTVGQLSSNYSEVFAKTVISKIHVFHAQLKKSMHENSSITTGPVLCKNKISCVHS